LGNDTILPDEKKSNPYAKYSSLAIQLVAVVVGLTFLGHYIDEKLENIKFPLFTVVLAIFSVVAALYYMIKVLSGK